MNAQPKRAQFIPSARILDVTEEEYFADPCAVPSLSQSIASLMLSRSPLHAWSAHPRLGGAPTEAEDEAEDEAEESTPALNDGKLLHKLMLGKGVDVVILHFDDFRTKIARQMRDEAIEAGKLPIKVAKYDRIAKAAELLRDRCASAGYPLTGESEVAIEWTECGVDGPVLCRCRMDHVFMSNGVILDIKKVRNAHPRKVAANFVDYGYDIQQIAYPRALRALRPELTGRIEFTFLFMELTPPHCVVPAESDGAHREIGELRWQTAVTLWERCLATNHWPGYTGQANPKVIIEAPAYVIQRELGTYAESL